MRFSKYIFLLFLLYLQACFFISSIPTQWSKEKRQRIEELYTIIKICESLYKTECCPLDPRGITREIGYWNNHGEGLFEVIDDRWEELKSFKSYAQCLKRVREDFKLQEAKDELKKLLME